MKVIWTDFAIESLRAIFDYYAQYVSEDIAHNIRMQILGKVDYLIYHPELGQIEDYLRSLNQHHRYLISGNYKIIYRVLEDTIIINDVFDVRQNPQRMLNPERHKN